MSLHARGLNHTTAPVGVEDGVDGRTVVATIAALQEHHDRLRATELDRARRLLAAGTATEQILEQLARGLTNKFLHAPMQALNNVATAERAELLPRLHHLYDLPDTK
jgi:glutamyl-tRNA reductase